MFWSFLESEQEQESSVEQERSLKNVTQLISGVHAYMAWSQKFRLTLEQDADSEFCIKIRPGEEVKFVVFTGARYNMFYQILNYI